MDEGIWNSEDLYPRLISDKRVSNTTRLVLAGKYGFTRLVRYLIPESDVRAWNSRALRESAQFGQLESVKLLLDAGADIHAADDGPLAQAIIYNQFETVKYLIQRGANIRARFFIYLALGIGNLEMVKYFLSLGLILNDNTLLIAIERTSEPKILRFLLRDRTWPPESLNKFMKEATTTKNIEMVKILLTQPWSKESLNEFLATAIRGDNTEMVELLLDNGAKMKPGLWVRISNREMRTFLYNHPKIRLTIRDRIEARQEELHRLWIEQLPKGVTLNPEEVD